MCVCLQTDAQQPTDSVFWHVSAWCASEGCSVRAVICWVARHHLVCASHVPSVHPFVTVRSLSVHQRCATGPGSVVRSIYQLHPICGLAVSLCHRCATGSTRACSPALCSSCCIRCGYRGECGPHDAGHYNSRFWETKFFCDGGRWNTPYGDFFLSWYSGLLLKHADVMLGSVSSLLRRRCVDTELESVEQVRRAASHLASLLQ